MSYGQYTGQFEQIDAARFSDVLDAGFFVGQVSRGIGDALRILSGRSLNDLHRTALHVEAVIARQAAQLATEENTSQLDKVMRDLLGPRASRSRKNLAARAAEFRHATGDVNLWLQAGAENAPISAESEGMPSNVSRAEYFAVIAAWKALDLRVATRNTARELRRGADTHFSKGDDPAGDLIRSFWDSAMMGAAVNMLAVAELSADLTRAATLATEAEYFDRQIALARGEAEAATRKTLEHIASHRLREAGAQGGKRRAERYAPTKARAVELYKAGAYRSRSAAATDIYQILTREGVDVAHSTVLKALVDHDRQIEATRKRGR